jgi:hypothetical protein
VLVLECETGKRVKIKHPLRQLSKNIAKKLAIAWAILWNFCMINLSS